MKNATHPVEQEELMAYLDGELPLERASAVAAHLDGCPECSMAAGDFRMVTEQLAGWQVEGSPARLTARVTSAVEEPARKSKDQATKGPLFAPQTPPRPMLRRLAWALAGGTVFLVLLAALAIPNLLRSRIASQRASEIARTRSVGLYSEGQVDKTSVSALPQASREQPEGPMIIRSASLILVAKDFDKARIEAEAIVRRYKGYQAHLTVSSPAGAGRSLTATIRVPATQLDAVMAELKKLGRVEQETQGGEEVTRRYVDLNARLKNARNTEQRLTDVLRERTGKVADILAVEEQIERVRGEIEQMDAERKSLENQVEFATLELRLAEEYQAQLEDRPLSSGTRLRNAAVEGYHNLAEDAMGLVTFLLSYGPSLLFWGLLLFFPARYGWRRLQARRRLAADLASVNVSPPPASPLS